MLVWIENAPTLETNSEREIIQFVVSILHAILITRKQQILLVYKVTNILEPEEKKGKTNFIHI